MVVNREKSAFRAWGRRPQTPGIFRFELATGSKPRRRVANSVSPCQGDRYVNDQGQELISSLSISSRPVRLPVPVALGGDESSAHPFAINGPGDQQHSEHHQ